MFTDYLMAVECLYFFALLRRKNRGAHQISRGFWAWAFLFSAVASASGGTMHGFAAVLPAEMKLAAWKLTQFAAGLVSFYFTVGTAKAILAPPYHRLVLALAAVKLLLYWIWTAAHDAFIFVIIDYGSALLLVFALAGYAWWRRRSGNEIDFILGVAISILAAVVQASGFSLHENFNHNDLYHVIQMVALYFFFRGARPLTDRAEPSAPAPATANA